MLPETACLFSALAWAVASGVYKKASAGAGVFQVNLLRCMVSVVLGGLSAWALGTWGSAARITPLAWFYILGSGLLARLIGDSLFLFSAAHIGLARAMPVAAIYPVWSALIARLVQGEESSAQAWVGMGLALAGVVLVIRSGAAGDSPEFGRRRGDLTKGFSLALACSLAWGLGVVYVKWGSEGFDPFLVNTLRMASGGLSLAIVLAVSGKRLFPAMPQGRLKLSVFGALESWLASAAYVYGITHTPTAAGATLSSLAPVFSIPVAVFYLKEKITPSLLAGILFATAGVVVLVAALGPSAAEQQLFSS